MPPGGLLAGGRRGAALPVRACAMNLNPAVSFGSPAGFCGLHNHGESSGLSKAPRRVELTALQIALEGFAEDAIPALHRVQLLRSLPQLRQEAGDPQVSSPCFVLFAMRAADCQRHLPGMLGLGLTRFGGHRESLA